MPSPTSWRTRCFGIRRLRTRISGCVAQSCGRTRLRTTVTTMTMAGTSLMQERGGGRVSIRWRFTEHSVVRHYAKLTNKRSLFDTEHSVVRHLPSLGLGSGSKYKMRWIRQECLALCVVTTVLVLKNQKIPCWRCVTIVRWQS